MNLPRPPLPPNTNKYTIETLPLLRQTDPCLSTVIIDTHIINIINVQVYIVEHNSRTSIDVPYT